MWRIDVAFITETHLKPKVSVNVPGFRIIRLDRTNSTSTAAFCRVFKIIEAVGMEIFTSIGDITLIVVYCPAQATAE